MAAVMAYVLFLLYIHAIGHEKKKRRSKLLNDGEEDDEKNLSIYDQL